MNSDVDKVPKKARDAEKEIIGECRFPRLEEINKRFSLMRIYRLKE
jgi:hypothetical protein